MGVYALGSRLKILHEFTSPAKELQALLEGYRNGNELPGTRSADGSKDPLARQLDLVMGARVLTRDEWATQTEGRVHTTLRALQFIADHLSGVRGRKSVIWISAAFPPWLGLTSARGPKANFASDIEQCIRAVSNANVAIYPVDARGLTLPPDFQDSSISGFGKVQLEWAPRLFPVSNSSQDSMKQLAEGTGGRA